MHSSSGEAESTSGLHTSVSPRVPHAPITEQEWSSTTVCQGWVGSGGKGRKSTPLPPQKSHHLLEETKFIYLYVSLTTNCGEENLDFLMENDGAGSCGPWRRYCFRTDERWRDKHVWVLRTENGHFTDFGSGGVDRVAGSEGGAGKGQVGQGILTTVTTLTCAVLTVTGRQQCNRTCGGIAQVKEHGF